MKFMKFIAPKMYVGLEVQKSHGYHDIYVNADKILAVQPIDAIHCQLKITDMQFIIVKGNVHTIGEKLNESIG